jgi:beta-lactam-binding protein with PASTA domain
VFDQEPDGGDRAERGSLVELRVSSGRAPVPVPDVEGQSQGDAEAALRQAGFDVQVRSRADDEEEEGTVLRQDPRPGTEVRQPFTVTIEVSSGPAPVVIPDVRGQTAEQAAEALASAGFDPENGGTFESDQPEGTVIRTDPPIGSSHPQGTVVRYAVSGGPPDDDTTTTTEPSDTTTTTEED